MAKEVVTPVVIAVIVKDARILFLLRTKMPFKGLWSLPGGKIERHEYVSDALKREVLEETGLHVSDFRLLGVVSELVKENNEVANGHMIQIFEVSVKDGEEKSSHEGELRWFSREEIAARRPEFTPTDFFMLEKLYFSAECRAFNCLVEKRGEEYHFLEYEPIKTAP